MAAVVTAFNPDDALLEVCASVRDQVALVVVVDDGSPTVEADRVEELLQVCRADGAVVVRHEANLGIGAALNTGIRTARAEVDPAFVLTLDQDSVVPPGYVEALVTAAAGARAAGLDVGLVGPERVEGIGSMAASRPADGPWTGREPIQSGLLVPASTLDALGAFDADLFIDGVDSDYYLRALAAGRPTVVAPGTHLGHRLGSEHDAAGVRLVHAAPFRYYYIARNRVVLVRRYARSAPGWCARAVLKDLRHLALTTVAVPGRRARLSATVAGLRDARRGRTGRRPDPS